MIQSLEPTIVDHDSETDISEPPFDITLASPITPQSTSEYRVPLLSRSAAVEKIDSVHGPFFQSIAG